MSFDFDLKDWLGNNTWEHKKIYNENYFLILPGFRFLVRYKQSFTFNIFVRKGGEQFGESISPMAYPDTIKLNIFKASNLINSVHSMSISNTNTGEISCILDQYVFNEKGKYTFNIEFGSDVINNNFEILVQ